MELIKLLAVLAAVVCTLSLNYVSARHPAGIEGSEIPLKKTDVFVGYLPAIRGELKERQGLAISGAISLALQEINEDPKILPNVNLVLQWNDTKADPDITKEVVAEMIDDGVSVLFGPENACASAVEVSESKNIPVISYKCPNYKSTKSPIFARTDPSDRQVVKPIITTLKYYGWRQFSIVHEENWKSIAKALHHQAQEHNMTAKNIKQICACCEKDKPCNPVIFPSQYDDVITEIKDNSRIFVFLGYSHSLEQFMKVMDRAQLFQNGEYMVIFVDLHSYEPKTAYQYLWHPLEVAEQKGCTESDNFLRRSRSLLVITMSQLPQAYVNEFAEHVREYNQKEPFNFVTPRALSVNFKRIVTIYAAHLYDAVQLYARALHHLLSLEPKVTEDVIKEVASDGAKITAAIKGFKMYTSITGSIIHTDKYGDPSGDFVLLALQKVDDPTVYSIENFTCRYQMAPVGKFEGADFPTFRIHKQIQWANNVKPDDFPICC